MALFTYDDNTDSDGDDDRDERLGRVTINSSSYRSVLPKQMCEAKGIKEGTVVFRETDRGIEVIPYER